MQGGLQAGAVMVQDHKICRVYSKTFSQTQSKYPTTRKDVLSILWGVLKFQHLMNGMTLILTDHKPLENWLVRSSPGGDLLLERWALKLQEYPIQIIWRRGSHHGAADFMSRVQAQLNQTQVDLEALKQTTKNLNIALSSFCCS